MRYKSNESLASKIIDSFSFKSGKKKFTGETLFKKSTTSSAPYENNVIAFPQKQNSKPILRTAHANPIDHFLKLVAKKEFKNNSLIVKLIKVIATTSPQTRKKYVFSALFGFYVLHSIFPKLFISLLPILILSAVVFIAQKSSK